MIRNLWAFLVGDWHRSNVWSVTRGTLLIAAWYLVLYLPIRTRSDDMMNVADAHVGGFLSAMVGGAVLACWPQIRAWASRRVDEGQQIIRTREQSRRERGQLSVRDQGGELSGVE